MSSSIDKIVLKLASLLSKWLSPVPVCAKEKASEWLDLLLVNLQLMTRTRKEVNISGQLNEGLLGAIQPKNMMAFGDVF
ncbi:hypothetical protein GUJ93_ZPchr0011g27823 [Zizania palustris]|uniref:Uncharacterized protein n=1 Tax=Zizania palustris TaxID=103762 RepID=A0A8J6BL51_ZIZPA|nr:hypothetical protein GUJ93_ZPchr0011g27823 [Zizania palustris]